MSEIVAMILLAWLVLALLAGAFLGLRAALESMLRALFGLPPKM